MTQEELLLSIVIATAICTLLLSLLPERSQDYAVRPTACFSVAKCHWAWFQSFFLVPRDIYDELMAHQFQALWRAVSVLLLDLHNLAAQDALAAEREGFKGLRGPVPARSSRASSRSAPPRYSRSAGY